MGALHAHPAAQLGLQGKLVLVLPQLWLTAMHIRARACQLEPC